MARVASTIPNLFNGVSQQADVLRLLTQGERQFNMYPSLVQGLVKRPPLEVVAKLTDDPNNPVLAREGTFHVIDRGGDNEGRKRNLLYVAPSGIAVYTLEGTPKAIMMDDTATGYLSSSESGDYSIVTIADHTFIASPRAKTKMSRFEKSPDGVEGAVFNIKQAAYDSTYTIEVGVRAYGSPDSFRPLYGMNVTPSSQGTTENPPPRISTTDIAFSLAKSLYSSAEMLASQNGLGVSVDVYAVDSCIAVIPEPGFYITYVKATDSRGDTLTSAVFHSVQRFSDLPAKAIPGMVIKVTGSDTTRFNDYYVRFEAKSPDDSFAMSGVAEGVWKECPAPGIKVALDTYTMPHVLIDNGVNFTFGAMPNWGERIAGDEETAPDPEFIGRPITGMFQYRNRLGLMSEDVVALSEASEFFNFFPSTVITQVDSDPIFLSASLDGAPILKHAVPFNEEVILFADRSQFKLVSPEVLSPSTAAINTLTTYPVNTRVKPISNGKNIFFLDTPSDTRAHSRVYEYFIDSDTGTKAAMDITAHVPQYVDASITAMTCSPSLNLLCLYTRSQNKLWFYKYYWSGQEKLQSAWFECSVGKDRIIKGAAFVGDVLYLLVKSSDGFYLCKMDFGSTLLSASDYITPNSGTKVAPEQFKPFLDMLQAIDLAGSYDGYSHETTFTIPACYDVTKVKLVDRLTLTDFKPKSTKGRQLVYSGDVRGSALWIGEEYDSSYTFTRAFVRDKGEGGSGQLTAHAGRLQLQKWRLILGPTGFIEAVVDHLDGRQFVYPGAYRSLGMPKHYLGNPNMFISSILEFPVRSNATNVQVTIRNNSWLPSTVVSAEWEGNYITKGLQRI